MHFFLGLFLRAVLALVVVAAAWSLDAAQRPGQNTYPAAAPAPQADTLAPEGQWMQSAHGHIPMPPDVPAAHASALLVMPADDPAALTAFWFAGDRESAPNVQITASQWDRAGQTWSPAQLVVNRHAMGEQLGFGLRRLGNPVGWLDAHGRMHLFVVATGWGGWAASRVLHLQQVADTPSSALRFEPVRVLPLSWLWNLSYLVRTAPLPLVDGGAVLPAYFELGAKTPVALRLDSDGQFLGMVRISRRTHTLQPALLATSPSDWLALLRDNKEDGKIRVSQTHDAGRTWSDAPDLPLDNPDSGIAALRVGGQNLLVYNPSTSNRQTLRLASSPDGTDWTSVQDLEQGPPGQEYSYPAMAWEGQSLWISYTDQRKSIAWQRLSWIHGSPDAQTPTPPTDASTEAPP